MAHTRRLDQVEERICGALMEKQQTTPDNYPLTVNSLVAACNQKSNRDPVVDFSDAQVRDGLERLRKDVLVWRTVGGRAEKWDHRLQSRWHLNDAGLAIMTLLLLRGALTPGELRSRATRLHAFESVADVESTLVRLAEGENALVRELPRQPGQRENRWQHLMSSAPAVAVVADQARSAAPHVPSPESSGEDSADLPDLAQRLRELEGQVEELSSRLAFLESQLGVED